MKIDRFKAQIDDLQRSNRYNVSMFGTGAKNAGLAIRGLRCESASLPGRGFFSVEESEYDFLRESYLINHNMTNLIVRFI